MPIKEHFSKWIGGLRQQASSLHPRSRVTGIVDYYNEQLETIGEELSCWRLAGERDDSYRHRLALHVEEAIIKLEATREHLLDQ